MRFQTTLTFLGMQDNELRDGGRYYTINFFDVVGNKPVAVNVMENTGNAAMIDALFDLAFGDKVECTFQLVEKDKLYRLALRGVIA